MKRNPKIAFALYGLLALLAATTIDSEPRIITLVILAALAAKTWIGWRRENLEP